MVRQRAGGIEELAGLRTAETLDLLCAYDLEPPFLQYFKTIVAASHPGLFGQDLLKEDVSEGGVVQGPLSTGRQLGAAFHEGPLRGAVGVHAAQKIEPRDASVRPRYAYWTVRKHVRTTLNCTEAN